MQKLQRIHLKQTIDEILENPEKLKGNHPSVGFVIKGIEELRDLKKSGTQGYRIYFTIANDSENGKKNCVIIGLSKGKSTTDVPSEEKDHFVKLAKNTKEYAIVSTLKEVEVITESCIGICIYKNFEEVRKFNESSCFSMISPVDNEMIAFFSKNILTESELYKKRDELNDNVILLRKWMVERIFGKELSKNIDEKRFDGYVMI